MNNMKSGKSIKPDFLIIGTQKCATTWLWDKLRQHPGTDLPLKKEPHFFSLSEFYNKGYEWYYKHFSDLAPSNLKRMNWKIVLGETLNFGTMVAYI